MKKVLITALAALLALSVQAKDYKISSPDGRINVMIQSGSTLSWSVSKDGTQLMAPSKMCLTLADGIQYGPNAKFRKAQRSSVSQTLKAQNYKRSEVKDNYNQLKLVSKQFDLIFRVADDGVAYRFVTKKAETIASETAEFNFPDDPMGWIPYVRNGGSFENQFFNSFENVYSNIRISAWDPTRMAFLPVTLESTAGPRICITESDLLNYPGMYLCNRNGGTGLEAMFAGYPKTIVQGGHNMLQGVITSREPYIYKGEKGEELPWRVMVITDDDASLADNDLVWRLAKPSEGDFSWVKPGKVAWDWWNDWNIKGVDFASGINNDTYKYYIDFAAAHGVEYVILDEGWAVNLQADLMQVVPEIDLPMLSRYAIERGVKLVLWAGYWAFNRDMEGVCKHYSEMGIAGWKIDFMNRDDQPMVAFYEQAARTAAKYHQFVDFHGAFKPAGLIRTWPNVLNFEGVNGLEQLKWMGPEYDEVTYDVTIPFTRLVAGPCDYTQGAMRNAIKANYYPCDNEPMSQGTRCRQLAEYIVFDAPFTMLCDSPTNYEAEEECTRFIASVPTVWDETIALDGRIGDYVVMARRSGGKWYLAAMTDWDARDITIKLPFEAADGTEATLWRDGVNAHRNGQDYRKEAVKVSGGEVKVHLAPGGGCVVVF
ncbi:MAG: glycoside hydrolase family 97 protein [Bacteroidales bacterium]|nr:glycoside hydrolase family 97 protein [Bacteroidales bacterium]